MRRRRTHIVASSRSSVAHHTSPVTWHAPSVGEPRRGSGSTPASPAPGTGDARAAPVLPSILPGDLSASAGTSELRDPLLAAVAAAPDTPPSELEPGVLVGESFRIERRLGAGGMGVVYLAH